MIFVHRNDLFTPSVVIVFTLVAFTLSPLLTAFAGQTSIRISGQLPPRRFDHLQRHRRRGRDTT
jgi:hypothetical protein